MSIKYLAPAIMLAVAAAACQQIPDDMTVAEYCANPDHAGKDVCKVYVEVDGQKRALADTNMSLGQARQLAESAMTRANEAYAAAETAQQSIAEAAQFNCETRTIQRSKTGACGEGYRVLSCTQTRYTYRAGGPSILREISDEGCRFNDQVLEMQVRCCTTGPAPIATQASVPASDAPTAPSQPVPAS